MQGLPWYYRVAVVLLLLILLPTPSPRDKVFSRVDRRCCGSVAMRPAQQDGRYG